MINSVDLEQRLISVRTAILEDPHAERTKEFVERELEEVQNHLSDFQPYNMADFLHFSQLMTLGIGFTRRDISDIPLLLTVADVIPESLGIDILFPVVYENGKRGLWSYDTVLEALPKLTQTTGKSRAFILQRSYGKYALFVSGIFPDILARVGKKGGVDIEYYEKTGATALNYAAKSSVVQDAPFALTLEQLARHFSEYRQLLNEAGALIGTQAKQTFVDDLMEKHHLQVVRGNAAGPDWEKERLPERMRISGRTLSLMLPPIGNVKYESGSPALN